jgi:hypothetical protein
LSTLFEEISVKFISGSSTTISHVASRLLAANHALTGSMKSTDQNLSNLSLLFFIFYLFFSSSGPLKPLTSLPGDFSLDLLRSALSLLNSSSLGPHISLPMFISAPH